MAYLVLTQNMVIGKMWGCGTAGVTTGKFWGKRAVVNPSANGNWTLRLLVISPTRHFTSVVMVSKILPSVGFGRFCKKNLSFRFGFGSHN